VAVGWGSRVLERCGIDGPRKLGLMAQVYMGLDALLLWFPPFFLIKGPRGKGFQVLYSKLQLFFYRKITLKL
jgi:hypothetical protein